MAAGLLTFGLSYWWLGDAAHEIAGSVLLVLLVAQNAFNRRWYGRAARRRPGAAEWFGIAATAVLGVAMLVLAATSAAITTAVPSWLPGGATSTARQLHVAAAYWAFAAVAVHLGLRWPLIMGVARRIFGLTRPNQWRTAALRVVAAVLAVQGVRSAAALGMGGRLTRQISRLGTFEQSALTVDRAIGR